MSTEYAGELERGIYPRLNKTEEKYDQLERRIDTIEADLSHIKKAQYAKSKYVIGIVSGIFSAIATGIVTSIF
ncbi:hypothetical protein [Weissella viridescens]|uniref:hypothetical protein n=1 Tax=Weissella viridescens TaxID=1629 RepID=UPI0035275761